LEEIHLFRFPGFQLKNVELPVSVHRHKIRLFLPTARLHEQKEFVIGEQPIERLEKNVLQPSLIEAKGLQAL